MSFDIRKSLTGLTGIDADLRLFDYGNVIVRHNYKTLNGVRILSGGVAVGNDLSHATLVGKGLLTAAILGKKAVPCSRKIMRTINELVRGDQNYGIFIICQNNSEAFNFQLAADLTSRDCTVRINVLTVGPKNTGKEEFRCLGDVVVVIKIIGAMAEKRIFYNDIYEFYKKIQDCVITVYLTLVTDGEEKNFKLTSEPEETLFNNANSEATPIAVLVNTHKSMSKLEEFGLIKHLIERFNELGQTVVRIYLANFILSTTREDVKPCAACTILKIKEPKILEYLDFPCNTTGWSQVRQYLPKIALSNEITSCLKKIGLKEIELKGPKLQENQVRILTTAISSVCETLEQLEKELNSMDSEYKNVGTRVKKACDNVRTRLKNNKFTTNCPYAVFKKLSIILPVLLSGVMGSVHGVIFESAAGIFRELPETQVVSQETWLEVLNAVAVNVTTLCSSNMEMKTMSRPIGMLQQATMNAFKLNGDILAAMEVGVSAAEGCVKAAVCEGGKAPDPGAYAVVVLIRSVLDSVVLLHGMATRTDEIISI